MCKQIGVKNMAELVEETIPLAVRARAQAYCAPQTEEEWTQHITRIGKKNLKYTSLIGQGYYNSVLPAVIRRCVLENPAWYTAYTPYQAEISQGRLEVLFHFQTMICELTGMEVANASLLDEATACAEAMLMCYRAEQKAGTNRNGFFVDHSLYRACRAVLHTRAQPLGIELVWGEPGQGDLPDHCFGALVAYQNTWGDLADLSRWHECCRSKHVLSCVQTDLLMLTLFEKPATWGSDVCVGSTQRLGLPLGYGGPHSAFLAAKKTFIRDMPGRIIGESVDATGKPAFRLMLQTREQHIKRSRATSNICTSQVLPAVLSTLYVQYHGAQGLRAMADRIFRTAIALKNALVQAGYTLRLHLSFDTVCIQDNEKNPLSLAQIRTRAQQKHYNFYDGNEGCISFSLDEHTANEQVCADVAEIFELPPVAIPASEPALGGLARRTDSFLQQEAFTRYRSETQMLRYIYHLQRKDFSLCDGMIPLGSCTMKLNSATSMFAIGNEHFAHIHPLAPPQQTEGYTQLMDDIAGVLKNITGFAAISFQPNSGAQGEYAGLLMIRAYHRHRGHSHRRVILIPVSAHGTNPASAALCGFDVVDVQTDQNGAVDWHDFQEKIALHAQVLAGCMITYPSTYGLFDQNIRDLCACVHEHGGLVYMDGANMNAQVGYTSPAAIGADICHLNLHKTFGIPHGGGGPGCGPVCVTQALAPFLPASPFVEPIDSFSAGPVSQAPYGNALMLVVVHGYLHMLGTEGLRKATACAILAANYMKERIQHALPVLFAEGKKRVAHEFIIDFRAIKKQTGIDVIDIAKRLIDFRFHPPTVSFPIPGTLMIEPTESESKEELDRFCEAFLHIANEIQHIASGQMDKHDNPIKNAPHTYEQLCADEWAHPYSRQQAAFPVPGLRENKFWPPIARINDAYGDRNPCCSRIN